VAHHYELRVKGRLRGHWSDWFDGLAVTPLPQNETLLAGQIVDEAALHGILDRIRDLNLELLYLVRDPSQARAQSAEVCHGA
jgi:hypothetical protein